jgi:hypothetical protein
MQRRVLRPDWMAVAIWVLGLTPWVAVVGGLGIEHTCSLRRPQRIQSPNPALGPFP